MPASTRRLEIRGAQEHNLKGVDLDLPRDNLIVLTGVSGSGKSSLAFDTVFREGQRRYLESLSAYARQFVGQMEKPRVEHIAGLSPTVAVDQKTTNRNPRSTVGTITEIYDYLRVLYARIGTPHCPNCGREVQRQSVDDIVARVQTIPVGRSFSILAPIVRGRKGEYRENLAQLLAGGYSRVRVDGEVLPLDPAPVLNRYKRHTIEVVVDRLTASASDDDRSRTADSVQSALSLGDGIVTILFDGPAPDAQVAAPDRPESTEEPRRKKTAAKAGSRKTSADGEWMFSRHGGCPTCGISLPELEPRLFSFNSTFGACPKCGGLGKQLEVDVDLVVPDKRKSLRDGALAVTLASGYVLYSRLGKQGWEQLAQHFGFSLDTPWQDLSDDARHIILNGSGRRRFTYTWRWESANGAHVAEGVTTQRFPGVIAGIRQAYESSEAEHIRRFMSSQPCPTCHGRRLRPDALAVTFAGHAIDGLAGMSVDDLFAVMTATSLSERDATIGGQLLREIRARLGFLLGVGLGYLSVDRSADSLSGGEAQRLRLAAQLGAGLTGVLYVLDEPSIGLHHRDNHRLLDTLRHLRDRGNTVMVVEHDEDTIRSADWVVDFGPGAGRLGGEVVVSGAPAEVQACEESLTGQYLRRERTIAIPDTRRAGSGQVLRVVGASEHNLQNITVEIPLGALVAVTGVSGSGKSTLVDDIIKRALARQLHRAVDAPGRHERIEGVEHIDKVIEVDQSPIGRTPRSNPATYTGVMDHIRALFAALPESKVRGYKPGRFSFNVKGGRCEACGGAGSQTVEMQFLADVEVPCEVCGGKRYNNETLRVRYHGQTISDVLQMSVADAADLFAPIPTISRYLRTLVDVGLGYISLGQSSTTISGGEAQRVKLAEQLARPSTHRTLYVLDEPTTGLHFDDVRRLLDILHRLVDAGNTVLVVEHNPDVIKCADWVIDLGPEGGEAGGLIVATGTPENVASSSDSHTGKMLADVLADLASPAGPPQPSATSGATALLGGQTDARFISVRGARKHNLKGIDVDIPKRQLVVVTGVSGSGKSSLAMDTVFAEGQRRFVECLSSYARQFLGRLDDAAVERIDGLSPAIAIDQENTVRSPRSTVATATEIYDYLRLLFARLGIPNCPECQVPLVGLTSSQIVGRVARLGAGTRAYIAAPVARHDTRELREILDELREEGFTRALVGKREVLLEDSPKGSTRHRHDVDVVVDRVVVDPDDTGALADSIELALARGQGAVRIAIVDAAGKVTDSHDLTRLPSCPKCGFTLEEELTPRSFSPNYHAGACDECKGLGFTRSISPDLLIIDADASYFGGAIGLIPAKSAPYSQLKPALEALSASHGFSLHQPWKTLAPEHQQLILMGNGERVTVRKSAQRPGMEYTYTGERTWHGVVPTYMTWYRKTKDPGWARWVEEYMADAPCPSCDGAKLKPLYRSVRFGGMSLGEICRLSVRSARETFATLKLDERSAYIAQQALKEIGDRLGFLDDVGLGYVTLDRLTSTLSGGEAQRIRLATQVGSRLVDALYVLDEPSIGLHQRDVGRLLTTLGALRDQGNTVIVVEHDEEIIRAADHVIDVGPGPGDSGGYIVAQGTVADVERSAESATGAYLRSGGVTVPHDRPPAVDPVASALRTLTVVGASEHNLKEIDVEIPLGRLVAVTGVSGSGKSTLVADILEPALRRKVQGTRVIVGRHRDLLGWGQVTQVIAVDQSPIGRSPKSNPATYTGVFDEIREVFAELPEARARGFTASRFSFNDRYGACSACGGEGVQHIEMHFLADVDVTCDLCGGKRYNAETLSVKFHGHTIADILQMKIDRALGLFQPFARIRDTLQILCDVGLGYMQLGQSSKSLSGGEAQRVKLASELCRGRTSDIVYILDEPTVGLHFADVDKLLIVLRRLVSLGNTVIVVEHNLDVIAAADQVIDLGIEGGDEGGSVVVAGTPRDVAECPRSHTGRYLSGKLAATAL